MKESARYILPILVLVALILSIGTTGYLIIEDGMTVSDAFYMTVTAITPTQFHEVHELSVAGRYFTVVLVFCGFGAVVAFATQFARLIVQSELEGVGIITRKQMSRRIKHMKNHYIVCGFGEIGEAICDELKDQHLPFVVITDEDSSIASIDLAGHALVRGNPTADTSLKQAGVDRALGVIAVLADDADNLFISLAARELNPKILIIARGKDSSVEDRILRAGADIVVSPMRLGGQQIAELIKQRSGALSIVSGATTQSSVMGLRLNVHRNTQSDPVTVAKIIEESQAIGAAGIERQDGSFHPNPAASDSIQPNEAVVLITKTDQAGESFQAHSSGKTILLADDHRALRLLFSRKLTSAGHDVIQAATGDEALRLSRARKPDLIVLDINMPRRDGYSVCAELRREREFADVPIILYSGEDTEEFLRRGLASGADMCIRKTSKSSELLARIEEAFSRQRDSARPTRVIQIDDVAQNTQGDSKRSSDLFDLDLAMENVDGDPQLMGELVSTMLHEAPVMMEELRVAVEQSDQEALRLTAHSLKSSVEILGARDATAAAAKLESAARNGDLDSVDPLAGELRIRIDALMSELEHYAASGNGA